MNTQEIFFELARDKLAEQFRVGRSLDARTGTVAAAAAALSGVAALLLKDFSGAPAPGPFSLVIAAAIGLGLLLTLGACLRAIRPKKEWRHDPPLERYLEGFEQYPNTDPIAWTGRQISNATRENEATIGRKADAALLGMRCMAAMVLLTLLLAVAVSVGI